MKLGTKLKHLRKYKGFTQNQVAECAGINQSTFSMYENNEIDPSLAVVEAICKALELSHKETKELLMETKFQQFKMYDPDFVMMLKDVRNMTYREKKTILDAYQLVQAKRTANDQKTRRNN